MVIMMSVYDYSVLKMDGTIRNLGDYKNKVLLIVNTATDCGFTPQYAGLQELHEKYRHKGLEILDFPCNQFASQAPGSNEEIATFCTGRFGITFEQFAKIDVNGENEDPLYTYLKKQQKGLLSRNIKWNFTKFLVGRNGEVVKRFGPNVEPAEMEKDIIRLLGK